MSQHTKKKITRAGATKSVRARATSQIARDKKALQTIITSPAFKKHRVILPGSRAQMLQDRIKTNRKKLK